MYRSSLPLLLLLASGCSWIPQVAQKPVIRNPFPQLSQVAVAPFINLSTEPTVDGRQFALAYFNELQLVQGFEVVPLGVVEDTMRVHKIDLASPADARRLAQVLGVDAVVVGAVTDFSPYYPPRCGLQVEWYAANPCFHPIPPGYGLPWGTRYEEEIPERLVFEAEMARARDEFKSLAPEYEPEGESSEPPAETAPEAPSELINPAASDETPHAHSIAYRKTGRGDCAECSGQQRAGQPEDGVNSQPRPPNDCLPSDEPVLRHTRTYNGHEPWFAEALESYYFFRTDARFGGWRGYLQRSDDFIRFCCHVHISEMLSARGGAGQAEVVWRWPMSR